MAILRFAGDKFVGTEADRSGFDALVGASFWATDSLKVYQRTGIDWEQIDVDKSLLSLTDVVTSGLVEGHVLFFDDSTGEWVNRPITESEITDLQSYLLNIENESIGDLLDVNLGTLSNEEVLAYDAATQQWVNVSVSSIVTDIETINDINDVTITTGTAGQVLRFDGSNWVNVTLTEDDISDLGNYLTEVALNDVTDVILTTPTSGNFIRYNGSDWVNVDLSASDIPDISSTYQVTSEKGEANGYASLNSNAKVPTSQLPALAITDVLVVEDISARDSLVIGPGEGEVQEGDVAVVTDASGDPAVTKGSASYIYDGTEWTQLKTPDITAPGADTQVLFNDNGDLGASASFTFDDGLLSLTGNLFIKEGGPAVPTLNPGESTQYVITDDDDTNTFTQVMLRIGDRDYIVATHIDGTV